MSQTLVDTKFLDALATSEPTPGGGSAAALTGAIAAGLVSMVCNLTIGQKKYADVQEDVKRILTQSEELRARLTALVEEDMAAYQSFADSQKMPRATDGEKRERTEAMQRALRRCTLAPMGIAEACRQVLELCPEVVAKGNPNAVTDAGVAALLAESALRSAGLQVQVNLAWLKDEAFIQEQARRLEGIKKGVGGLKEKIVADVEKTIGVG